MRLLRQGCALAVLTALCACGSTPGPTPNPTPNPTPTNRAPSITSMSFTPSFGIQQLTTFSFSASASDPDGDSVSYAWDISGFTFSNSSGNVFFTSGGTGTARLTVSDGKGLSSTDTRTVIVGSATGNWVGSFGNWNMTSNLTQTNGTITGNYGDQLGPGTLDAFAANTIDANGNITLRYKQATFDDFTFTGTMDISGRRITGVVNGSGYSNQPFVMTK